MALSRRARQLDRTRSRCAPYDAPPRTRRARVRRAAWLPPVLPAPPCHAGLRSTRRGPFPTAAAGGGARDRGLRARGARAAMPGPPARHRAGPRAPRLQAADPAHHLPPAGLWHALGHHHRSHLLSGTVSLSSIASRRILALAISGRAGARGCGAESAQRCMCAARFHLAPSTMREIARDAIAISPKIRHSSAYA